ncbi:MAG: cyclic nucleotide-binding/CBS domain-containing protein [Candidatus Hydrothermarchaeaceae archaeon]
MDTEVRVKEAMTRKVVTLPPTATTDVAAKKMADAGIGSIVVVSDKPLGIVTERDMCYSVIAKDKRPAKVKIKDIMSTPLKTVSPGTTLTQASRMMARRNIRRLPVMENDRLIGIITNKDLIAIAPETIEILEELTRINSGVRERHKEVPEKGTCEICSDYMVSLEEVDGTFVCETCKEEISGGE